MAQNYGYGSYGPPPPQDPRQQYPSPPPPPRPATAPYTPYTSPSPAHQYAQAPPQQYSSYQPQSPPMQSYSYPGQGPIYASPPPLQHSQSQPTRPLVAQPQHMRPPVPPSPYRTSPAPPASPHYPQPPPPPPGAAPPQLGRLPHESTAQNGQQPSDLLGTSNYGHHSPHNSNDSANIIGLYGSSPSSAQDYQQYQRQPPLQPQYQQNSYQSSFQQWSQPEPAPAPLNRSQSAAVPTRANPRPQYPTTPYSTSTIPTIPAQLEPSFSSSSSSSSSRTYSSTNGNGYSRPSVGPDPGRRPSSTGGASPRPPPSQAPEIPSRPSMSRPRPSVDSTAVTSAWSTPVDAGSYTTPSSSGSSTVSGQTSFDKVAIAKKAVADAAGGYHEFAGENDHYVHENGFPTSPAVTPSSTVRQPATVSAPILSDRRSPSLSLSQNSVQHPAFSGPIASRQGTLSPNASLSAAMWLSRQDSISSSNQIDSHVGGHEFLNPALLSNIAVYVKDKVPRGLNSKGALEFPETFTGEQLVTTIQSALPGSGSTDRRYALQIARSLQQSLWFNEVDWSDAPIKDAAGHAVYTFENALDELPTGVLTSHAPCYSPFCGKLNEMGKPTPCYSYSCPNMSRNSLQRAPSMTIPAVNETVEEGDNWISSVPASVKDSLGKREVKRQLVIFELIQTEVSYNQDLDVIQEGFVEPLVAALPPIIPPERMASFLSDVLLNVADIRNQNHKFLERLLARQRENYIVKGVGDLVLRAVSEWSAAYVEYAVKFNLADAILKEEKADNPRFNEFLMDFHKFPKAAKAGFESFHKRPPFRLLRYNLILKEILKNTEEDHPDVTLLTEAIAVLAETGKAANKTDPLVESKVACRNFQRRMRRRPGDAGKDSQDRVVQDLNLLAEHRRHFHSGKIYRKPDGATFTEWSENHLILFDHFLVTTKAPKERDGGPEYRISRRPVPLELLQFRPSSFVDPPLPRSTGFHLRTGKFGVERSGSEGAIAGGQQESPTLVYPISLYKIGRNEGLMTFYVESQASRKVWEAKLKEALELRVKTQEANRVVQLDPLSDRTFAVAFDGPTGGRSPTCSAPLTVGDGQSLVIAGCESGLFIGFRGQSMRQVVALNGITQCAVLQEYGLVLVLAQGALIAYALEALIPSGRATDPTTRTPQRLSGKHPVIFFRVGKVTDSQGKPLTLVIYNKKGGVKESVFKALEPISVGERSQSQKGLFGAKKTPEWFRTHKDFFLPSFVLSVQFLRSKLAIVLARGVEIMDLTTLRTMSVPNFSQHRNDPTMVALQRRCEEAKTLGMFRLQDNLFILVYDEFAFHVDKHGEPIAGRIGFIDWESKPETVAFQWPYIYAFSSNLIEIRHAVSGHLAQVIPGQAISLTYDGSGIDPGALEVRSPHLGMSQPDPPDKRIHFTMRAGEYHKIFEIVPAP